jgi:hypothetical protein
MAGPSDRNRGRGFGVGSAAAFEKDVGVDVGVDVEMGRGGSVVLGRLAGLAAFGATCGAPAEPGRELRVAAPSLGVASEEYVPTPTIATATMLRRNALLTVVPQRHALVHSNT